MATHTENGREIFVSGRKLLFFVFDIFFPLAGIPKAEKKTKV